MKHFFVKVALFSFAPFTVGQSAAQTQNIVSTPEVGVETLISAGGDIYSYVRVYTINGARIETDTKAGDWLLEDKLPKGTVLVPVATSKKFKGCIPYPNTFDAKGPCLIDDDGDGTLDRHSRDEITLFRKVKEPVPYTLVPISIAQPDSLKRTILYQGATADSLRFSYREFKDDMARPAFTEELSIPREPFPAMIMVKNLQIEVLSVSGMGLRYRVVKVN